MTIAALTRQRGIPPTVREIGAAMGIRSINGVTDHLLRIARKGYLKPRPVTPNGAAITRSIQLTKKARAMFDLRTDEDCLDEIRGMFKSGLINIPSEAHASRFADLVAEKEEEPGA